MQNRVGSKILSIREKNKLSQKQLAKKLGVSESFIKDVELGKKILNEALINKLTKLFKEDMQEDYINVEAGFEDNEPIKESPTEALKKVNEVWSDAFSSVIKKVPIYDYSMKKPLGSIDMPVMSNKIEGFSVDKVMFLKIEEDEMLSMRIHSGDLAFSFVTSEIQNNGIYLVEYGNERVVRQIRNLDHEKLLLISHRGKLSTDSVNKKEVKVLAKLIWLKVQL